jgi:hypothetical protein
MKLFDDFKIKFEQPNWSGDLAKELKVRLVQIAGNMPLHEMSKEQIAVLVKKAKE